MFMVSLNFFPPFDQLTPLFPFFTNNFDVCLHISKTCRIQIFLLRFHSIPSEFEFFNFIVHIIDVYTGKSLSEALIFASTNPQYDNRLFIELQVQFNTWKFCTQHVLPRFELGIFMYWTCNSMSSYCGLVDAKIRASDKDLPWPTYNLHTFLRNVMSILKNKKTMPDQVTIL